MITNFISAKNILAKLYRDLGINSEINESDIYEWIAEALSLIGAYSQYNEVPKQLELVNGKAKLPLGFYKLVDASYKGHPIYWSTNTNASNYKCDNCRIPTCNNSQCKYTFYINDSYLISNINEDTTSDLCIIYLGIPVDDEGIPMLPDNVYYMKALTAYITFMLDYQDWRKSKIADKIFQKSEQDWLFYVNSARGAANMPNVAQLENLKNIMTRLLPIHNDFSRNFKNFNKPENLS